MRPTGAEIPKVSEIEDETINALVGRAIRGFREERSLTIRRLSEVSRVSPGMISRIEGGRVSPSLSTLKALADALGMPLANLFQHTAGIADISYVKAGGGLPSRRYHADHEHDFRLLGHHRDDAVQFEPAIVTIERRDGDRHPFYLSRGFVFIYVLEGEAVYGYGDDRFEVGRGDSVSFDASVRHGFVELLTPSLTFLSVFAKRN
ncbi:MAG: helix-turn-helix domain-containing protein [Rhizobiales bacterium]|nr:helix-turn-helix domain-containing protein [Hyphomicrobiales bacterium]